MSESGRVPETTGRGRRALSRSPWGVCCALYAVRTLRRMAGSGRKAVLADAAFGVHGPG